MPETLPSKVLIVDSDTAAAKQIANSLEKYRITSTIAENWEKALYYFNTTLQDLCLVELELPDLPGSALLQKWRNHEAATKRNTAFILMTTRKITLEDEGLLKELGDVLMLPKPIQLPILLSNMVKALALSQK